jgi:redox-sensitive bicupin YhaK (pirin superfamily)
MKTIFHPADKRGNANHGWLQATHSFSFANFYDSEKVHFGKLRVLNDDVIAPSLGFDIHPHQDMEIITIPLSGELKHGDNMGNEEIIRAGEVQVMSAGTGIFHSEYNASETEHLSLFQIWIFPDKKGHKPRYDQKLFPVEQRENQWQLLVSPNGINESLSIHQNAYISMFKATEASKQQYQLHRADNGVYFMLVYGQAQVDNQQLKKRDAAGVWQTEGTVEIEFSENSEILALEVPMQ